MHRGHDHDDHHHGNGSGAGHNHASPPRAAQWQTPHLPQGHHNDGRQPGEPDLDLVEMAFVEGFAVTKDPASFLRLARIPFEAVDASGARLALLRIESAATTDVGALSPQLGGGALRYDPLPARMVTHRRRLRFVYFDGTNTHSLALDAVRALKEALPNL